MCKKRLASLLFLAYCLLHPFQAFAQVAVSGGASNQPTVGTVAQNLTTTTYFFSGIVNSIFYVIGIALFTGSIIQYREFRNNPSQTPLRKPIILCLAGIGIGFFPIIINYIANHSAGYGI